MNQFFLMLNGVSRVVVPLLMKQILFSLVIFFIVFLLAKIFRRLSPYWHLGLWTLVLLRLLLPPNLSHSYSARNLLDRLPYYQQISQNISEWLSGSSFNKESGQTFQIYSLDTYTVENQQSTPFDDSADQKPGSWQNILFLSWLLGVIIFTSIYLNRIRQIQKLLNNAQIVKHTTITQLLNKWQRQFHIKRKVQLFTSAKFLSPFTFGLIRPKIYIPQNFLEQNNLEHLESILAHEMAHIKRRDHLWLKIQYLIQILYFFHPVVWYVNRKINLARECLCDRLVLSNQEISSLCYGKSMINVLKLNLTGTEALLMLPGFGSHKDALKYRINNINGGTTMKHTQFIILYASLFILGCLILPMAGHVIKQGESKALAAEVYSEQNAVTPKQQDTIVFIVPSKQGKFAAPFGKWIDPFTKKEAFHNGVDIAAPKGTGIYAAADGKVIVAESAPKTHGNHIVLQHENDFQTFYSHCETLLVQAGQSVKAGELIARVGNTGRSTGPHLHFEIRKNNEPVNPTGYINFKALDNDGKRFRKAEILNLKKSYPISFKKAEILNFKKSHPIGFKKFNFIINKKINLKVNNHF